MMIITGRMYNKEQRMKKENAAKLFLRQYLSLCGRIDALQRAISAAEERAMNTGVILKAVKVLSSPAEHDPMAADICTAIDACEMLIAEKRKAEHSLQRILDAIGSMSDERQKQILTMRYINGDGFIAICEAMHYEKTQIFVLHGRALVEINKWLFKHPD